MAPPEGICADAGTHVWASEGRTSECDKEEFVNEVLQLGAGKGLDVDAE